MNRASCRDHEAAVTRRVLLSLAVSLLTLTLAPSLAGPNSIRSDEARPFEIQGHRGAKGLAPENSIAAFEKAIALGVDTLEMDAQSTSDRVLVVYHDQKIDRARCRRADAVVSSTIARYDPRLRASTARGMSGAIRRIERSASALNDCTRTRPRIPVASMTSTNNAVNSSTGMPRERLCILISTLARTG